MPYFSMVPQVIGIIFMRKVHEDFFLKKHCLRPSCYKHSVQVSSDACSAHILYSNIPALWLPALK